MGKRKRKQRAPRVLKECNRSARLSKIIGRALAGMVDGQGGTLDLANGPEIMLEAWEQFRENPAIATEPDLRAFLFGRFEQAKELGLIAQGATLSDIVISADGRRLESTMRGPPLRGFSVVINQIANADRSPHGCALDQVGTDGHAPSEQLGRPDQPDPGPTE